MTGHGYVKALFGDKKTVEECKFMKWLFDPDLGWEHPFCTIHGEKTYLFDTQECEKEECENYESNQSKEGE